MNPWIEAARPKTLPLAFASIIMGSMLAYSDGGFQLWTLVLGLATTLALQILSNFANDLGDTLHGADTEDRLGPRRLVQSGIISRRQMRSGVILSGAIAFILGIGLLLVSLNDWQVILEFIGLGVVSIAAAILYTNGKRPYGYMGLGDLFVLLFFGLVGVGGIHFLHIQQLLPETLLPSLGAGALAVAVLNLNNMRDILTDGASNKNTIPVLIGLDQAKSYHGLLLLGCLFLFGTFNYLKGPDPFSFLYLIAAPLLVRHWLSVKRITEPAEFAPYLKQMALLALATDVLFGLGHVLSSIFSKG